MPGVITVDVVVDIMFPIEYTPMKTISGSPMKTIAGQTMYTISQPRYVGHRVDVVVQ